MEKQSKKKHSKNIEKTWKTNQKTLKKKHTKNIGKNAYQAMFSGFEVV